jgi:hypothetical protein
MFSVVKYLPEFKGFWVSAKGKNNAEKYREKIKIH